jgi:hypothetical protein
MIFLKSPNYYGKKHKKYMKLKSDMNGEKDKPSQFSSMVLKNRLM